MSFELFKKSKRQKNSQVILILSVSQFKKQRKAFMKYFVSSQICHLPPSPAFATPSVYIHEHHYVYPYTHQQYPRTSLCPLLERLRQEKPKKSAKILSGNSMCVWAIPALGKSSLDRLTWSIESFPHSPAAYLRGYPTCILTQPDNNCFILPSTIWEHQAKTTDCEARMIGNTLSAGWKRKLHKTQRFFYASHWGPITDP